MSLQEKMKVLALGGAGDMGRMAVAILLEAKNVSAITVADINHDLANTFVNLVDSPKLSAVQLDVLERDKLLSLMSKHDLIINCVGPFYKFEIPILKAAIEAKKPIVDICDDAKPTLDALKLSDEIKDAGITALMGMGASPGILNLLAVRACSKLDKVDEIITSWGFCLNRKEGKKPKFFVKPEKFVKELGLKKGVYGGLNIPGKENAAIMHLLYECVKKVPTYKDGKLIEIEALTEAERFAFPGYKDVYACHIGHPEPATLYRTIETNSVSNLMRFGETATGILRQYREKIKNEELSLKEASLKLNVEFSKLLEDTMAGKNIEVLREFHKGPPTESVIAIGTQGGIRKKVGVALLREPYGEMAGRTGVSMAIGTLLLIEGRISKKGLLTPEEAFPDPTEFFDRLAHYCGKNLSGKDILVEREVNI
ncbi:MAG: hypothetical protein EU542_08305 [Promethearchaeota archaeon]|nr:MAG: hypothetical protein EU542_08305 [Candidatus Lokiarchaeota archaeon]